MEQDQGASAKADRAATLSEPSQSSVVSGVAGIPCAFTPGPWEPKRHGSIGSSGVQMYWLNERLSVCTENDADVRLIAAAPELYEALTLWLAYDDQDEADFAQAGPMLLYARAIDATRNALAKARGQ